MCLLDNMCVIESEVLAPPSYCQHVRVLSHKVSLASYEQVILGLSSVIVHGSMIRSHRWKKTVEK